MWAWKRYWLDMPAHFRSGLVRLYVVVVVPWVAFYAYQIYSAVTRSRYISHEQEAIRAFWLMLLLPVGAPILFVVIAWVLAGFRTSTSGSLESNFSNEHPTAGTPNPIPLDGARKTTSPTSIYVNWETRLWWGLYPLPTAFWGLYVVGSLTAMFLSAVIGAVFLQFVPQARSPVYLLGMCVTWTYWMVASVGVWRSASLYKGGVTFWPACAKFIVGLYFVGFVFKLANGGLQGIVSLF